MKRVVCLFILVGACHSDEGGSGDLAGADLAAGPDLVSTVDLASTDAIPIAAPDDQWTWIDIGGNVCDDGSPTGIGVNPKAMDKLVVYFEGGGACGDYASCYQLNTATHGPFGASQFAARVTAVSGSIFDRNAAGNPFADWSYVYVPYCTGDVHSGDRVNTYSLGSDMRMYHHWGHANAMNALDRIAPTWPMLSKLVVTGASAGGFGSTINYTNYRERWPGAQSYLIDDSGPLLSGNVTPQYLKDWYVGWGVGDWIAPVCPNCITDASQIYPTLAKAFPNDRLALLESLQDGVIRQFYAMQPTDFQTNLLALAQTTLDPLPNFHYFFVPGETHTMEGDVANFTQNGVPLWSWMTQMVTNDAAWTTQQP